MKKQPETPPTNVSPGLLKTDTFIKQPLEPQNVMTDNELVSNPTAKSFCCCDVHSLCALLCCGQENYHECCNP